MNNLQYMKMNVGYFFPKKSTSSYPCPISAATGSSVPHGIGALSHSAHTRSVCIDTDRNAELASMTAFSSTKMEIKTKPKIQRRHSLTSAVGLDPDLGLDFNPCGHYNPWVPSQEEFQMSRPDLSLIPNPETRIHIRSYLESIPSDAGSRVRVDEIQYHRGTNDSDINKRTYIKRYTDPPSVRELKGSLPSRINKDVDSHIAKCSTIGIVQDTSVIPTNGPTTKEAEVQTVNKNVSSKTKELDMSDNFITTYRCRKDSESVVITTKRESVGTSTKVMEGESDVKSKKEPESGTLLRKSTANSHHSNSSHNNKKETTKSSPRDLNFYPSKENTRQIINDLDKDMTADGPKSKPKVSLKFLNVQSSEKLVQNSRKQLLAMSEEKSKKFLEGKLDKSQGEFVGRSGLTYTSPETATSKSQEQQAKKTFARSYINEIVKETVFVDRKKNELLKQWPAIFHEMIYSAVADMSDVQGYAKRLLEELEKS